MRIKNKIYEFLNKIYEFLNGLKKMIFGYSKKQVKITIEKYLEGLGEVTDQNIVDMERKGYFYMGGNCKVRYEAAENKSNDTIKITFQMYFKDKNDKSKNKVVKAERKINPDLLVEESILMLQVEKEQIFEIEHP